MDYLLKQKQDKIEADAERIFGNDMLLKSVYVMTQMGVPEKEQQEVMETIKNETIDLVKSVNEMKYTLNEKGEMVGVENKISE